MTEDEREHFEERAAILEFDAKLTRKQAEAVAARAVADHRNRVNKAKERKQ